MTDNGPAQTHTPAEQEHVDYSGKWAFGAGSFAHEVTISGPSHEVRHLVDTDNPSLIRWAVFVVTFVPTATTLIAKLPEIITAITNALSR